MDASTIAALIAGISTLAAAFIYTWLASYAASKQKTLDIGAVLDKVKDNEPVGIKQIAKVQLELSNNYYKIVLQQSKQSFVAGVTFGSVGLVLFASSVTLFTFANAGSGLAYIPVVGGVLTELISAINFYLYGRASSQLETFHVRLDKTQTIILADSICESLDDETKYQTRAELVKTIAASLGTGIVTTAAVTKKPTAKDKKAAEAEKAKQNGTQEVAAPDES